MTVEPHPDLPPSLYKYCSQDAARAILSNKTLQLSRPGLFNDGFDLRIALAIDIDEKAVIERALDQIYEGVYGPEPFPAGNKLGASLLLMRVFFRGKLEPDAFKEPIRPRIEELVANRKTMLRQLCDELAAETAKFKVLCLSSSGTIAPMWGNYAENTGPPPILGRPGRGPPACALQRMQSVSSFTRWPKPSTRPVLTTFGSRPSL